MALWGEIALTGIALVVMALVFARVGEWIDEAFEARLADLPSSPIEFDVPCSCGHDLQRLREQGQI